MYDLIIIGAGPAGATLARLVNKNYKVLVIEKRSLRKLDSNNKVNKPCGGLIAPDAQRLLGEMGLGVPKKVLVGPQVFSVRSIDIKTGKQKFYQRHYINIDREKFDQYLVSLIPNQVRILEKAILRKIQPGKKNIEVFYQQDRELKRVRTRKVIGADGANSLTRKILYPGEDVSRYLYFSIQEIFSAKKVLPYFTVLFDEQTTDYYSWIIPKEKQLLIGSAIDDMLNARAKFEQFLKRVKKLGLGIGQKRASQGAFIYRPTELKSINTGRNDVVLVGEAAGFISPSSAEGLSFAFLSALALAKAMEKDFDNALGDYNSNCGKLIFKIIIKNWKKMFMFRPWLRNWIMATGLKSMKVDD
ncbi:MAG: FAD-binding protein [Candidatus Moranbacteria bacterium]|nr:FAD-binding protein [Candidatus Moranbacteria bacterium]